MIRPFSIAIFGALLACAALAQEPASQPAGSQDKPAASPPPVERKSAAPETATAAESNPKTNKKPRTMDRLELDSTAITGNRELPKVLYIVPWKKSDLGDLAGRPTNSLLDEVLAPVDREVFRRQTDYYAKLNAQTAEETPEQTAAPAQSN